MVSISNCGLHLEPEFGLGIKEIVAWAKYAEREGYGYMFQSDHLLPIAGFSGMKIDSPECWVALGAVAASTNKLQFGPLVSPVGFRNPALLARMACTLHSFTDGRVLLGVGAGWYEPEYAAHGYDFPALKVRMAQFQEAIQIIRPLIEGKEVDFAGKYYAAHTSCLPKPKGKMRLIVGGRSRSAVMTAAKYADEWNFFSLPVSSFLALKSFLGRGPDREIEISMMGPFMLAETKAALEPSLRYYERVEGLRDRVSTEDVRRRGILCGTVDEFMGQLKELVEAGVQKFYFRISDRNDTQMVDLLTDCLRGGF